MLDTKILADAFTIVRFSLGIVIVLLGLHPNQPTAGLAISALLAAWVSDILDGPLARRSRSGTMTWVGEHDLLADVTVAAGAWLYLGFVGWIDLPLTLAYLLLAAFAWLKTGSQHVGWGIQAIPYAAMIAYALQKTPPYGWVLVLYVGAIVLFTWPRFPQKARAFIDGITRLIQEG